MQACTPKEGCRALDLLPKQSRKDVTVWTNRRRHSGYLLFTGSSLVPSAKDRPAFAARSLRSRYADTTKLLRQSRILFRRFSLLAQRGHTRRGRSPWVVHTLGFHTGEYNEDTGKQDMLFPRVHFKTSPSFSSAAGRFTHKSCNG
jgi:hypothetical protein